MKKGASMSWKSLLSSLRLSARRFTDRAIQVVNVAGQQAAQRGHPAVSGNHVLMALALVERGPGRVALERLGVDLVQERAAIAERLASESYGEGEKPAPASATVEQVVDEAVTQAHGLGHDYVGTEHLTLALLSVDAGGAGQFLRGHGINEERLREVVLAVLSS